METGSLSGLTNTNHAHNIYIYSTKEIYVQLLYNLDAPKKPTNLTVNSDLLSKAKALHINISFILESALAEKVKQKLQSDWLQENSESIAAYNTAIDRFGVFGDDLRSF